MVIGAGFIVYSLFTVHKLPIFQSKHLLKDEETFKFQYTEGYGQVEVEFEISYAEEDRFYVDTYFTVFAFGDIKSFGMTYFNISVKYGNYGPSEERNFTMLMKEWHYSDFIIDLLQYDKITNTGNINVQFLVDNDIKYEEVHYEMEIMIPKDFDFFTIKYNRFMGLLGLEIILVIILLLDIGLVILLIIRINRETQVTERDRKRNEQFWNYISKKAKDQKEEP